MAAVGRIPPREVVRIFISIVLRGLVATVVGVVAAKLLLATGIEPSRQTAITVGYVIVGLVFALTFVLRRLEGPQLEYLGVPDPDQGESLISFLYEDEDGARPGHGNDERKDQQASAK